MAPRERARAKISKTTSEEYVLLVNGVPPNCRWQELKDYVGENGAPHRRQAQTYPDANGNPSGQGSVIIRDLEEAQRVYRALSRRGWNGHPISVTLAKRVNGDIVTLEGPTKAPELSIPVSNTATYANNPRHLPMASSPISLRTDRYAGYSSAADPQTAYYPTAGAYPPMLAAPKIVEAPNFMTVPYRTAPLRPVYAQYQHTQYPDANSTAELHQTVTYNPPTPSYTDGHHMTAPRMSRHTANRTQADNAPSSTVESPNRTVFLSKLPYNAVGQAVKRLLEPFGKVERCDVPQDRTSSNKIRGTASAKFREASDAARAIRDLNGTRWRGVTISARWDKDAASTSSTDSSSGRQVQARHSFSGTGSNAGAARADSGARDQRRCVGEGPLIVNGSRGNVIPSRSRRGSREDESDSSDYDDGNKDDSSGDEDDRPVARRMSGTPH